MQFVETYDGRGLKLDMTLERGADYDIVIRWQADLDLTDWTDWWAGLTVAGEPVELSVDATNVGTDQFVTFLISHADTALCRTLEWWSLWAADPNGRLTPIVSGQIRLEDPKVQP